MLKSQDAIAPFGEGLIVSRDERRQAMLPVQALQELEHSPSILLVQISGGFISEKDPRRGN